jgi:hypothetical protein
MFNDSAQFVSFYINFDFNVCSASITSRQAMDLQCCLFVNASPATLIMTIPCVKNKFRINYDRKARCFCTFSYDG